MFAACLSSYRTTNQGRPSGASGKILNKRHVPLSRFLQGTLACGVHIRIGTVAEEADETQGWLEFIEAAKLIVSSELPRLLGEATELSAIMSASAGTARYKDRNKAR